MFKKLFFILKFFCLCSFRDCMKAFSSSGEQGAILHCSGFYCHRAPA